MTETADVKDGTGEGPVTVTEPASGAILRAISDPGSILPRLEGESVPFWQLRAVLERAAPLIAAEAASAALFSLAAELDEWARQIATANAQQALAAQTAASLARVRARGAAHPGATEPVTVSGLPGDSPGGTGPENGAQRGWGDSW